MSSLLKKKCPYCGDSAAKPVVHEARGILNDDGDVLDDRIYFSAQCGSCKMRWRHVYVLMELDLVPAITQHAVDKFCSITGCDVHSRGEARLIKMWRKSEKVDIKSVHAVKRALNNQVFGGIQPTDYYEFDCYRFVVTDGVMVTFEKKY